MNHLTITLICTALGGLLTVPVSGRKTNAAGAFEIAGRHYRAPGDSLKRKALRFIEDNVDIHHSRTYHWENSLPAATATLPTSRPHPSDSMWSMCKRPQAGSLQS